MLYYAVCSLCGFLSISEDVRDFKQQLADHSDTSHKTDFGAFVAHIPLREFELFLIRRIRDKQEIAMIKTSLNVPKFWHTYRNHNRLAIARVLTVTA